MHNKIDFLNSVKDILVQRGAEYGDVKESFERISNAWRLTLGKDITPVHACIMMIDFKVARLRNDPTNEDSIRDIIGYACCLLEMTVTNRNEDSSISAMSKEHIEQLKAFGHTIGTGGIKSPR